MSFASPMFLFGMALSLVVGALLILGALGATRSVKSFGDPVRIRALMTSDPAKRRAWKGVLLVLATALAFFAAARPQYGKGTRLVPATNVDVVVVLDYSKSMYARDVEPSRIFRAKVEVARLIRELEGARFAAVAFAGEPMGFPLTADGGAIAQFLRQLDPNDMPVGGTAIARALEQARDLLNRDPKSADHKRIIVLVTDGEDLEGNPVTTAQSIGAEGTTVHVVQIGGRTPERIPEVGDDGQIVGWRQDRKGKPLTTALTVEGEQQLASIAAATPGGQIIRSEKGTTGIDAITTALKRQMQSELAERVETVYADIYFYPLGLAILLLIAEVFLGDAPRRVVTFSASAATPFVLGGAAAAAAAAGMGTGADAGKAAEKGGRAAGKGTGRGGKGKGLRDSKRPSLDGGPGTFPLPEQLKEASPWASYPAPRGTRTSSGEPSPGEFDEEIPSRKEARRGSK